MHLWSAAWTTLGLGAISRDGSSQLHVVSVPPSGSPQVHWAAHCSKSAKVTAARLLQAQAENSHSVASAML